MTHDKKSFALIELIVVIVIIGILTAISSPMISNMKIKAIVTEGVAGMSAIRNALRQYYVEYGRYPEYVDPEFPDATLNNWVDQLPSNYFPGLNIGDLDGTYFGKECYYVLARSTHAQIACDPDGDPEATEHRAPRRDEIRNYMDDSSPGETGYLTMAIRDGTIGQTNFSRSGYPPAKLISLYGD